ncbi:MAG: GGDEF domain-containing protein [Gammaproteobacteria bacterium]|nr:GGDEF domain-containing protein [Gammaproteobacteria bacterium]
MLGFGALNLIQGERVVSLLASVCAIALVTGVFYLRHSGNSGLVYRVNALLYLCLIGYMIVIGGEHGSKSLWAYTLPPITCFLLGYREGALWASLVPAIAVLTYLLPEHFFSGVHQYPPDFQVRFLVTYSVCLVISVWLEYSRSFHYRKSQDRSHRLQLEHQNLNREIQKRTLLEQELRESARTDHLTGLLNRGAFFDLAEQERKRHKRYANPLSMAIIDVDHFKRINDIYGHPTGDAVLCAIVECCRGCIREADIFGRIGGEEFGIVMSQTVSADAKDIADRLRRGVEALSIRHGQYEISCSISIGIYTSGNTGEDLDTIYKRADSALYRAKGGGRNQVCIQTV